MVEEPLAFRLKGCSLLGSAVMLVVWFLVMRSGKGKVFDGPVLMVLPFVLSPMAGISALLLAFPVGGSLPYSIHYALWFLFGCGAAFILIHMVYGVFRIKPESAFLLLAFSTLLSCSIATFACMQPGQSLPAIISVLVLPVLAYWLSIVGCKQKDLALCIGEGGPEELAKADEEVVPSGILGPSPERKIPRKAFLFPLMQMLCYSITFSFALFVCLNGGQEGMSSEFIWLGAMLSGVFILLYGLRFKERVTLNLIQYVLFGIAALGLAPLAMSSQLGTAAKSRTGRTGRSGGCIVYRRG